MTPELLALFPPLETFEFDEGYFEPAPEPEISSSEETMGLRSFYFETARLEMVDSEAVIHRRPGRAFEFVEILPNNVPLEMVAIPGGTFLMGAPEGEEHSSRYGQSFPYPQHEVTVPDFFLGKYPVTQAQWRAVAMGLPKIDRSLNLDPSWFPGDNCPVTNVNCYEAMEFCARLSQATGRDYRQSYKARGDLLPLARQDEFPYGRDYRLPSEAEWEYACRAGTTTPFAFGETITTDLANYNGKYIYGNALKGRYRNKITDVGSFPANAFGLYDMHGNVGEWCLDIWHDNYEGAPTDGSPLIDGKFPKKYIKIEDFRLVRGGYWASLPGDCRSAFREAHPTAYQSYYYYRIGFRVCCSAV
ncbi:hypothetical protein AY599_21705 [Leptolyngbya valderiana BDU 20041]|nr:formylglycine-generating enzyme family protein [Geitlerinema sp. CS-897]OAB55978.1 hypothetical protein AY599_21705 [Leptolyngbya valderiana BDU 20041]